MGHHPAASVLHEGQRGAGRLVARRANLGDRLVARLLAAWLDRRLATGRPPESGWLLAVRAEQLASMPARSSLARHWERLLDRATQRPRFGDPRLPVCWPRVTAAEPDLRAMLARLRDPAPVAAEGVAAAIVMLTDGSGPVYNQASPARLTELVRAVTDQLDPHAPLFGRHGWAAG